MTDKTLFEVAADWFADNCKPQDVFSESDLKEWARYEGIEELFTKKEIKAGETVTCHFDLNVQRDLGFVNDRGETVVEPGEYHIIIGGKTVTLEVTE